MECSGGKFSEDPPLFHGTRDNDPKLIYEGEAGFDMRYSSAGLWGLANYFAVKASYSDLYAYTRPDGYKEMFMVKVLTGDSCDLLSNKELRMPPVKPVSVSRNLRIIMTLSLASQRGARSS